jgi:hypothetical protein
MISTDIVDYDKVYLDISRYSRISPTMVHYNNMKSRLALSQSMYSYIIHPRGLAIQPTIPPILFFLHGIEPKFHPSFCCPPSLPGLSHSISSQNSGAITIANAVFGSNFKATY